MLSLCIYIYICVCTPPFFDLCDLTNMIHCDSRCSVHETKRNASLHHTYNLTYCCLGCNQGCFVCVRSEHKLLLVNRSHTIWNPNQDWPLLFWSGNWQDHPRSSLMFGCFSSVELLFGGFLQTLDFQELERLPSREIKFEHEITVRR